MTIEQKAIAYDEALKWVRRLYPTMTGIDKEDAEHYFPELRESEDERIRKECISIIDAWDKSCRLEGDYCEAAASCIAWLEKQSEQKPTDEEMKELLRTEYEKGRADAIAETQVTWSEEDERIRNCLIKDQEEALTDVKDDKYGHSEIISDLKEMYRERIDWLKSLNL